MQGTNENSKHLMTNPEIENTVNDRVKKIFDKLNARSLTKRLEVFEYENEWVEEWEEEDISTYFLRNQKSQLIDLKKLLERYVKILPVFGFNSGWYDLNLIKFHLNLCLICYKDIEPKVMKRITDFILCRFCDVQFLKIMNFLGGAATLDLFLKAYMVKRNQKKISPTNGLIVPNYHDKIPFSANWEITTLSGKISTITKTD